jgi:hypothetical protein
MSARFADIARLPLFGVAALIAGGLSLMVAAAPAIALPVASVSTIPSAVSPGAAHAA